MPQTISAFTALRDSLRDAVLSPVAPLAMTIWRSCEPLSFMDRLQGEEHTVQVGDRWGQDLFDCAWFHFTADLPAGRDAPLVARIDVNGELLVVDAEGAPVRGLTSVRSEFARCHGEPGKDEFPLPPEMIDRGRADFWADGAFNDLFGGVQGDGKVACAEICEVREDVRALYHDIEVLCDVLEELADDTSLCGKVSDLLATADDQLSGDFSPVNVSAARRILSTLFLPSDKTDALRVWAVGHGHLDLAWLWPVRETIRKGVRTFATAMANRKLYPEHIFGMSQPQLYAWIKERHPDFYGEVKRAVAEGGLEIQGSFWVEPDCNIPNGESLVRQVLHGSRFFKEEFGYVPRQCWQPDVFGYNGQLPQILVKSGHDAFMTQKLSWNIVNRFPHHSFHWEGIDGTSIVTHMLPEETYNGPAAPRALKKIRDEYAQRDVSGHALMCYGIGDGGGGPGQEHLERLRRLSAFESLPRVEIRPTPEFFEEWKKDAGKFPRWKGELYLERHQGTFTTQALVKRNNRRCEIALRELEFLAVVAEAFAGQPYPAAELDAIWKEVLLYQFHDILPGSSIKRVYDETNPRYAALLGRLEELTAEACAKLLGAAESRVETFVVNPLSHPREEWVEHEGDWRYVCVPAMGFSEWPGAPVSAPEPAEAGPTHLENEFLRVEFAADGSIASLRDKTRGVETLRGDESGNAFFVYPDRGDAWDFDADLPAKNVLLYLSETPQRPVLVHSSASMEGPHAVMRQEYEVGKSKIKQRIVLQAKSRRLDFETSLDWQETAQMLRVAFPTTVKTDTARFEIPFGSLQRSTREDDSVAQAQFEVPAQQWIDLSDERGGVALFNDCKYGFRVKGHRMEMTLLRSVPHPSSAVITVDDSGKAGASPRRQFTDIGAHVFRYAIQPHGGGMTEAKLTAIARGFNSPLRARTTVRPHRGGRLPSGSFISLDHPAVEITACKRAEDGQGTILRFCNVAPARCSVEATIALPFASAMETDLLENPLSSLPQAQPGRLRLEFSAFEIKTVRLAP